MAIKKADFALSFEYRSYPNKIYFGAGEVSQLQTLLNAHKTVMVFAGDRLSPVVSRLETSLNDSRIIRFSNIIQHVPRSLVEKARKVAEKEEPSIYVAIGGGSAVGLAKALSLEDGLPIIAVPTTYSGSEQTNIYGISTEEGKTTGRDDRVLPEVVIYDPNLTASMPKPLAVTSAMNAMAHLMEALYSPTGNPVTRQLAMQGIKSLKAGLEELATADRLTPTANENILFGAYLAGKCLCEVSMALHHKAAHVLGGSFGMEHSKGHTVLQAYVLAYQWEHLSAGIQQDFRDALSSDNPPLALKNLAANAGAATDLAAIGFKKEDIGKAASIMAAKPYANIAPLSEEGLKGMLENAFEGRVYTRITQIRERL